MEFMLTNIPHTFTDVFSWLVSSSGFFFPFLLLVSFVSYFFYLRFPNNGKYFLEHFPWTWHPSKVSEIICGLLSCEHQSKRKWLNLKIHQAVNIFKYVHVHPGVLIMSAGIPNMGLQCCETCRVLLLKDTTGHRHIPANSTQGCPFPLSLPPVSTDMLFHFC